MKRLDFTYVTYTDTMEIVPCDVCDSTTHHKLLHDRCFIVTWVKVNSPCNVCGTRMGQFWSYRTQPDVRSSISELYACDECEKKYPDMLRLCTEIQSSVCFYDVEDAKCLIPRSSGPPTPGYVGEAPVKDWKPIRFLYMTSSGVQINCFWASNYESEEHFFDGENTVKFYAKSMLLSHFMAINPGFKFTKFKIFDNPMAGPKIIEKWRIALEKVMPQ